MRRGAVRRNGYCGCKIVFRAAEIGGSTEGSTVAATTLYRRRPRLLVYAWWGLRSDSSLNSYIRLRKPARNCPGQLRWRSLAAAPYVGRVSERRPGGVDLGDKGVVHARIGGLVG